MLKICKLYCPTPAQSWLVFTFQSVFFLSVSVRDSLQLLYSSLMYFHTHFSHTPVIHTDDVTSFLKNIYNVRNTISLSYYIVLSKFCEKIGLRWVGLMLLQFFSRYDLIFWCNDNYLRPQLHNRDQLALGLATFSQYEKNILTGNQFHHQCPATASPTKEGTTPRNPNWKQKNFTFSLSTKTTMFQKALFCFEGKWSPFLGCVVLSAVLPQLHK